MADSLTVKLGADTSEFRGQIAGASSALGQAFGAEAGGRLGEEFGRAFNRKLGVSDVARAALVSLGIDAKEIADRVARAWTDMNKEQEEAYKRIGTLSTEVADKEIAYARRKQDAQQKYQQMLIDEQRLVDAIDSNQGKTVEEQLKKLEDRNKLVELRNGLEAAGTAALEEQNKLLDAHFKDMDVINAAKEKWAQEDAQRLKKQGEEDLAWAKKQDEQLKELHDLKTAALEPEERLKVLQSDQLALQQKITKEKQNGVDTLADEIKAANLDKDVQATILEILQKQTKEKKTQLTVEEAKGQNYGGGTGLMKIASGFQTYNDVSQQQQYDQGLINQAKAEIQYQINDIQSKIDAIRSGGSLAGQYELPALQAQIQTLQGRSRNVKDFVFNPNYQDAAGKGIFASQVATIGDPLGLQKKQTDTTTKVAQGIDDINNRLRSAGFGINGG